MYMVGGVLFAIYIYFTIWNIFRNNKAQQQRAATKGGKRVPSTPRPRGHLQHHPAPLGAVARS